jgi:hypothetical protein
MTDQNKGLTAGVLLIMLVVAWEAANVYLAGKKQAELMEALKRTIPELVLSPETCKFLLPQVPKECAGRAKLKPEATP